MSYLRCVNLSVYQKKKKIVKNVSFTADKGELIALLGLNGSGKTTLIKGICSLLRCDGEIALGDFSNREHDNKILRKMISYIPQRHEINFHISVIEVVMMGFASTMSLFEDYNETHREKALKALEITEMQDFSERDFGTLSEGQKQLVILSRALVQETETLLFDEPDSAMDFCNKHLIMSKINDTVSAKKCGILCLHDANFALAYCTRALLIDKGEIVGDFDIANSNTDKIKAELSKIYGAINIAKIDGHYVMTRVNRGG